MPDYHTPAEVAKRLRVSGDLVGDLIRRGAIPAIDVSPPGSKRPTYRISADALSAYERSRQAVPMPNREVGARARRRKKVMTTREYF